MQVSFQMMQLTPSASPIDKICYNMHSKDEMLNYKLAI